MIEGTVHRSVALLIAADLTRVHKAPELLIGDVPDGHAPTPLQQRGWGSLRNGMIGHCRYYGA